jgi:pimeloyl-ACP methyl ester carboxylesterase
LCRLPCERQAGLAWRPKGAPAHLRLDIQREKRSATWGDITLSGLRAQRGSVEGHHFRRVTETANLVSAPRLDAPMLVAYGAKDEIVPKASV